MVSLVPVCAQSLGAGGESSERMGRQEILRGPLQISADETVSRERGKIVEAVGNVFIRYEIEPGEILESYSQEATYNEAEKTGELRGHPKAVWKRPGLNQPLTELTAEKIQLKIPESELVAVGHVALVQGSSTLTAGEIRFFNQEKKAVATSGRPLFTIRETEQRTAIRAEKIVGWVEKKQVQFSQKVQGVVEFLQ